MARLVGARSILFMGRRLRRYTAIFGPKWFTPSNGLVRDHDAAFRAMIAVTLIVASGIANAGFRVAGSFGALRLSRAFPLRKKFLVFVWETRLAVSRPSV
jgi:hypothetical protein